MKRDRVFIITIALVLLYYSVLSANKDLEVKSFKGRVIYLTDEFVELKRGKTEILIYFTENSRFISKDGTEKSKEIIEVCQLANAYYDKQKMKNILNKIVILKESDCIK